MLARNAQTSALNPLMRVYKSHLITTRSTLCVETTCVEYSFYNLDFVPYMSDSTERLLLLTSKSKKSTM